jgi:hypothetical protein
MSTRALKVGGKLIAVSVLALIVLLGGFLYITTRPRNIAVATAEESALWTEQIAQLEKERDQVLYEDLGIDRPSAPDPSGLSPEKRQLVNEALRKYERIRFDLDTSPVDAQRALANRKARIEYLSNYLTPDELLAYRMNEDGQAVLLGVVFAEINPSKEEFIKLFKGLDLEELSRVNGSFRSDLEEKVKEALGPERYEEYKTGLLPENQYLTRLGKEYGLNDEQVRQLKELRSRMANSPDTKLYKDSVHGILHNSAAEKRFFSHPTYYRLPIRQSQNTQP